MKMPPREYFEIVSSPLHKNGLQRIGFEWYRFTDENALARMIEDGVFIQESKSKIAELEDRIEQAISILK